MLKWFYSRIKINVSFKVIQQSRFFYQWKADPMIIYVNVNKPARYWSIEEESQVKIISAHLEALGYCPLVRE